MFEREIKFIYDFNLNKVNRLGPYFTFEQLSRIDIHPAILNYISAEIDFLIFEDRQNLLKNSVFDYSGEKISNYFNLISDEVKKSKRFSLEYISKLILHASSFTVNYLIRPKWTLSKFVFDEGDHRTTIEIKQILNYVYYYQYLKKILISYINSKKIISMNSEEFVNLLERVDKLGIETYLPSILSHAVKSISDFFNIGEIQKNKIPFLAIEKFLEEKNLNDHLNKIHLVFGEDPTLKVSILDLQKTLDGVMIEKFEQPAETVIEEEEIKEEIPPIKELEVLVEDSIENPEEILDGEISPTEISDEENALKSKKLRIRIDKNNEIEPIDEELQTETISDEQNIISEESELSEPLEEISEPVNYTEENSDEEESIETEKGVVENVDENYEEEIIPVDSESELEETVDLEDENMQVEEEAVESVESEESEQIDELHPDKVYDKILQEEKEDEESMLQTILQSNQEQHDDEHEIVKEESLEDLSKPKLDVAELLEHKEMTRIIESVFDYDIEEFANTLDEISSCQSFDDAVVVINQSLKNRNISTNSKEAELFKSIISQYFTNN